MKAASAPCGDLLPKGHDPGGQKGYVRQCGLFDFDSLGEQGVHSTVIPEGSSSGPAEEEHNTQRGQTNDRLLFYAKDARAWKDGKKWVEAHNADIEDRVAPKHL